MAAPSRRGSSTASGSGTAVAATFPTVAADDLAMVFISTDGTGTITPPDATWLRMPRMDGHPGAAHVAGNAYGYWKICDGTETGTVTFTNGTSRAWSMVMLTYDGVNKEVPFGYVRSENASGDHTFNDAASLFADSLGLYVPCYNGNVSQVGATMTGGDAANWANVVSVDDGVAFVGVVIWENTANFAVRSMAGDGSSQWNTSGTVNYRASVIVLNAESSAPATVDTWVWRASAATAGSTSTTLADPGSDMDGGKTLARLMLPGMIVVGIGGLKVGEAITLSNWDLSGSSKAFMQVTGSPYNNTEAGNRARTYAGHLLLDEADCYPTAQTIDGTFSSAVHYYFVYAVYVVADPGNFDLTMGAFSSQETNTTTPDCPSFTVPENDSIAIAAYYCDSGTADPTLPAGYAEILAANQGSSGQAVSIGELERDAGTEDPGAITTGSARGNWLTFSFFSSNLPAPVNTVAPAITPTTDPDVDDVLSVSTGTWDNTPTSFTYDWQRSDNGTSGWTTTGGTSSTYTPTSSDLSKFLRCVVTASNATGSGQANSNVVGAIGARLTVTTPTFPSPNVGSFFSQPSTVPSGGTSPYTYAVQTGSLPAGITLNASSGVLSGVPTTAGASTFTVRVTDAQAQTEDTGSLSITVVLPVLAIAASELPDGRVGRTYAQRLAVAGGIPPYTFSVVSGSLPAGLSLEASTGWITGVPTAAGATRARIRVTDSAAQTSDMWL